MRTALTFVALLVGCSASTESDTTCGPTVDCDEGFACSVTHADDGAGECLPDDGDIDGDGLVNSEDYCNSGEGGRWDEDRDLIGDDCDRCPIAPPPTAADPDGDEVDSPCDPDPREPGDKIAVFNGFRDGLPLAWKNVGGWTAEFGDAIVTPAPNALASLTTGLPYVAQNIAVLVSYRIDEVDTASTRSFVGLTARDIRPASSAYVRCGGQRSNAQDSLFIETQAQAMGENVANAFNTASLYEVALRTEGLTAGCAMVADTAQVAAQAQTTGDALSEAGLFVQGATARFQYLLVIQRDTSSSLD